MLNFGSIQAFASMASIPPAFHGMRNGIRPLRPKQPAEAPWWLVPPAVEEVVASTPGQRVIFSVLTEAGADGSYKVRLDSGEVFDLVPRQWRQEHTC